MEELVRQSPDALIFDEALTNSPAVSRYRRPERAGEYFITRGGSLGVGIPGALGVKLANPDKTVIGFTGDGGSMYTIQALWTAARHKIGAKLVVCNNGSYRLLQLNLGAYWKDLGLPARNFPLSFDLSSPSLRFVDLARGMGVPARRVEKPSEIAPAVAEALAHDGPYLIDLVLEGDTHPELVGVKCGQ
jgi:thiamine pyrophosphate-dependent acetolactate synthase large subunit-like protein